MIKSYSLAYQNFFFYLQEISKYKLLDDNEEIELVRKIQQDDKFVHLNIDELIKSNARFVFGIAALFANQCLPLYDLIIEGNSGLVKAAKEFNETKSSSFMLYSAESIRLSIVEALENKSHTVKYITKFGALGKINDALKSLNFLSFEKYVIKMTKIMKLKADLVMYLLDLSPYQLFIEDTDDDDNDNGIFEISKASVPESPEDKVLYDSLNEEIEKLLSSLPERDADILRFYFGINCDRIHILEKIGNKFMLTRERIRQIIDKSLKLLKHPYRCYRLKQYCDLFSTQIKQNPQIDKNDDYANYYEFILLNKSLETYQDEDEILDEIFEND